MLHPYDYYTSVYTTIIHETITDKNERISCGKLVVTYYNLRDDGSDVKFNKQLLVLGCKDRFCQDVSHQTI
jgi:hypothetical protein